MSAVTARFDTSDDEQREEGLVAATLAIRRGELVVMPTDTVYGVGCDAFDPAAVQRLLEAKGRGREMPPPVLVSAITTLDALATGVPLWTRVLTETFWPGPMTLVCTQQSSLQWDLGDTRGTVAVRMPEHEVTLELIQRTGPLAVSSANSTGRPAATDVDQALDMLGDAVAVVLDAGASGGSQGSTIVDCTGRRPVVLREGPVSEAAIMTALTEGSHTFPDETEPETGPETEPESEPETGPETGPDSPEAPPDDGSGTDRGARPGA